jgi:multisubunit Na+/H+ antiporter MnhC subunit
LAGVALLIAALIRPETLLICLLAGIVLATRTLAARAGRAQAPPRAAWLILLGLLAIPLGAGHDLLLAGDPLYSLRVPGVGTGIRDAQSGGTALRIVMRHVTAFLPMLPLVGLGVLVLVQRRAWSVLVGLTALGPGIAAFVLFLGSRHVFVLDRYALPIDLGIILAGGVGFSALAVPAFSALVADRSWVRAASQATIAAALGLALSPTVAPLDRSVIAQIRNDRATIADFGAARPSIAAALDALPGARTRPDRAEPLNPDPGEPVALLVPARRLPQAAVDLALPLTRIARTDPSRLGPDGTYPAIGQLVYHDADLDIPSGAFAFLEVGMPTSLGPIRIVAVHVDPGRRTWVLRIDPP